MYRINRHYKTACVLVLFWTFIACSGRALHKTYGGQERPNDQLAVFEWEGTWYMGLGLYKADGIPNTEGKNGGTWECMYNDKNHGGFNVAVLPGKRAFELFNARTEPVSVFQVTLDMESGKTYSLVGNEKKFIIRCNGKEVKTNVGPIPVYIEPGPGDPHAVLFLEAHMLGKSVALFRVDGKVGKKMYKCHPKWVTFNNDNPIGGMTDFELRLSPGKHIIEYSVLSKYFGGRSMGFVVKTLEFEVQAGKKYTYKVIPDPEDGKSGAQEHTIEIVAQ